MTGRFWLGIGILVILLLFGIGATLFIHGAYEPVANKLELASHSSFSQGRTLAKEAFEQWQKFRRITSAFADHAPMEDIDSLFFQMLAWERAHNAEEFTAACSSLYRLVEALRDSHNPVWWNFL